MKYFFLLSVLFLGNFNYAQQRFCGTPDPDYNTMREWRKHKTTAQERQGVITWVPMSLHIVRQNAGTGGQPLWDVMNALCRLNEDFATANIQFFLKDSLHYINNTAWWDHSDFQGGADMVAATQIDNTMNCYIVQNPAGNCGYAWYGGAVVLGIGCNGANDHTWAHEAGHYFSLPHTFVGWEGINTPYNTQAPSVVGGWGQQEVEKVDGSNCSVAADGFCDTPPDYISDRWNCNGNGLSNTLVDPNGVPFQADGSYYMCYSNDGCMNKFSNEQQAAMINYMGSDLPYLLGSPEPSNIPTESTNKIYPENQAIINSSSATFTWNAIPGATQYLLQISRSPIFLWTSVNVAITDTSYTFNNILANKNYYWRVRPFSINGGFCATDVQPFTFNGGSFVSTSAVLEDKDWTLQPTLLEAGNAINVSSIAEGQFTLTDINGRTILQQKVQDNALIETTGLPAGLYIATLQTDYGMGVKKIMIHQ